MGSSVTFRASHAYKVIIYRGFPIDTKQNDLYLKVNSVLLIYKSQSI